MTAPDHAFVPCRVHGDPDAHCHHTEDGSPIYCGLSRSAHAEPKEKRDTCPHGWPPNYPDCCHPTEPSPLSAPTLAVLMDHEEDLLPYAQLLLDLREALTRESIPTVEYDVLLARANVLLRRGK